MKKEDALIAFMETVKRVEDSRDFIPAKAVGMLSPLRKGRWARLDAPSAEAFAFDGEPLVTVDLEAKKMSMVTLGDRAFYILPDVCNALANKLKISKGNKALPPLLRDAAIALHLRDTDISLILDRESSTVVGFQAEKAKILDRNELYDMLAASNDEADISVKMEDVLKIKVIIDEGEKNRRVIILPTALAGEPTVTTGDGEGIALKGGDPS